MKSFTLAKWEATEVNFKGDNVKLELRRLTSSAMLTLIELKALHASDGDMTEKVAAAFKLQTGARPIIKEFVREVEIEVDGAPITADVMCDYPQFVELVAVILSRLSEMSKLTQDDEKN